jgi:hypothetical protein
MAAPTIFCHFQHPLLLHVPKLYLNDPSVPTMEWHFGNNSQHSYPVSN